MGKIVVIFSWQRAARWRIRALVRCALVSASIWLSTWAPAGQAAPAPIVIDASDIRQAQTAYAAQLERNPIYANPALQQYVREVGKRLAAVAPPANIELRFDVIDSNGVFAYSFADGQIIVSRGILAYLNSEAQLAAILGHEIGHVLSLHQGKLRQRARKLAELQERLESKFNSEQARETVGALSLARARGYSREQEIEADEWSERLLDKAGYPIAGNVQMLGFLAQYDTFIERQGYQMSELPDGDGNNQGAFATHPSSATRFELATKRQPKAARVPLIRDARYLNALNGMVFGVAERYGIQRDSLFVEAKRRFAATLPEGWYVFGDGDTFVAASADNLGILRITLDKPGAGATARATAMEILAMPTSATNKGSTNTAAQATIQDVGTDGFKGVIAYVPADASSNPSLIAVLDGPTQRLLCEAFASPQGWATLEPALRTTIKGLHSPTPQEAAMQPLRIAIETAANDGPIVAPPTSTSQARAQIELLNQLYQNGRIKRGELLKTIR